MSTNDILLFIIFILLFFVGVLMFLFLYAIKFINSTVILKAKIYSKFNVFAKKNKIVFVGDSLTEFFQTDEFFFEFETYNRGIASDTTTGVLNRLQDNVINLEPSKVFVQIGTNDFKVKKEIKNIYKNITSIVEKIQENSPMTKIYIISLYPINKKAKHYSKLFTGKRNNGKIMEINNQLESYCNERNITYIDVYNKLTDEYGNLKKEYTVEGLHINFLGYTVIRDILLPFVNENIN